VVFKNSKTLKFCFAPLLNFIPPFDILISMNQDQVKDALLKIEDTREEFFLVFTGKKSKKVNGIYQFASREILIHNRNFAEGAAGENLLMYTAIHEYAHHQHACKRGGKISARAHTTEFWAIFHGLLEKAEAKGIYKNALLESAELAKITSVIREKYLKANGELVKQLGELLKKAHELCTASGGRWEDYIDRVLRMPRVAANMAVKMYEYNLNSDVGADNMRYLAGIKDNEEREAAELELLDGKSPDSVKLSVREKRSANVGDEDVLTKLEKEKKRIERSIESLTKRLEEINEELGR
jgi:hypothetical protein